MRAIVTVIGPDQKGIIAAVCAVLAARGVNIVDISQTVMQEFFTMTMLTDLTEATVPFDELPVEICGEPKALFDEGERLGLSIRIQNEDIFNAMHRI